MASRLGKFVIDNNPTNDVWGEKVEQKPAYAAPRSESSVASTVASSKVWLETPSGEWFLADKIERPRQASKPERLPIIHLRVETFPAERLDEADIIDYRDRMNAITMTPQPAVYIAQCPDVPAYRDGESYYRGKIADNVDDILRIAGEYAALQATLKAANVVIEADTELDIASLAAFSRDNDATLLDAMNLADLKQELRGMQKHAEAIMLATYTMGVTAKQLGLVKDDHKDHNRREETASQVEADLSTAALDAISEGMSRDLIGLMF